MKTPPRELLPDFPSFAASRPARTPRGNRMRLFSRGTLALLLAGSVSAHAANLYWDTSTTAGLQPGNGTWDNGATALWSSTTAGSNPLLVWTAGSDAIFRGTGTNNITVSGVVSANSLTSQTGLPITTLTSGTIQTGGITVTNGTLTINSELDLVGGTGNRATITSSGGSLILAGTIGQTTAGTYLVVKGTDNTFAGNNAFSGGLQIFKDAALTITNANGLGAGASVLFGATGNTNAGATLNVNLVADATISKNLIFGGGSGNSATINSGSAGAVIFTGTMLYNAQSGTSGLFGANGDLALKLGGSGSGTNTLQTAVLNATGTTTTTLTKQDSGTWRLSGSNSFTGATTVSAGTLVLDASVGSALAGTTSVSVNGGFLSLAKSDQINNAAAFTLNGGALVLNAHNDVTGQFSLTSSSSIDFGIGGATSLLFASSTASWTGTLTLLNFTVGSDILGFGATTLTGTQLAEIALSGYNATGQDGSGNVLFSAVPEPSTIALLPLGVLGFALLRRRLSAP